jgi:CheY-like chemotaxis protein
VVLLDIGMPRCNGYEAAERIRAESRDVVLIATTGWGQADDRRRALDAGFDLHLTKPIDPMALAHCLTEIRKREPRDETG